MKPSFYYKLVCVLILPVSLQIPAPRGLCRKQNQQCQGVYLAFLFSFEPEVRWHFGLWQTRLRTTKATAAAAELLSEFISTRLSLLVRRTEEVAARTATEVASGMFHLRAFGIWIWASSFLIPFPSGLRPGNFRCIGFIGT